MATTDVRSTKRDAHRKSRGRGLRTKTGCITCRKRHLKCDEGRPVCQKCSKRARTCLYPDVTTATTNRESTGDDETVEITLEEHESEAVSAADGGEEEADGLENERAVDDLLPGPGLSGGTDNEANAAVLPDATFEVAELTTTPNSVGTGASSNQHVGVATARWFEMIAEDANLTIDSDYAYHTPQQPLEDTTTPSLPHSNIHDLPLATGTYTVPTAPVYSNSSLPDNVRFGQNDSAEHYPWRSSRALNLNPDEVRLFAKFTVHISQWIDLFDPHKHFSALVPRLALHNVGLVNAILALSARHTAVATEVDAEERAHARDQALKYYHESLHYVRTALQYTSYHTSLELLATTLIISAFEMLDGSPQDWQRHLQGVFWIQRSQVIHGDSGGLQGAVWWAWLCQDIWAAFRSKRRVFTFWQPVKKLAELNPTQLAARSVYLLGRVINYCVKEDSGADLTTAIATKLTQARSLSAMLDEWESLLTPEFAPLPCPDEHASSVFAPVWVHPPIFASAVQLYHVSRLLIRLHQPSLGGFHEREKRQLSLNEHVSIICGIALKLSDYGASIASSMSLFIAGSCTTGQKRREEIVSLLADCRSRTGWPVRSLGDELLATWQESNLE